MADPSTPIISEESDVMRALIPHMDPEGLLVHKFNNLPTADRPVTYQPHCAIRRRSCLLRCHGHGDDYDISGLAAVVKDINENSGVRISSVRVLQGSDKERLQKIGIMTNDDMMVGEFDGRYHLFVTPRIASAPEKLKGKDPGGSSSTFTQREGTLGANLAEGIGVVLDLLNFNLQRTDDHRTSPKLISLNSSFADWFPESGHLAREQTSVPTFGELAERQGHSKPANATPGVDVAASASPVIEIPTNWEKLTSREIKKEVERISKEMRSYRTDIETFIQDSEKVWAGIEGGDIQDVIGKIREVQEKIGILEDLEGIPTARHYEIAAIREGKLRLQEAPAERKNLSEKRQTLESEKNGLINGRLRLGRWFNKKGIQELNTRIDNLYKEIRGLDEEITRLKSPNPVYAYGMDQYAAQLPRNFRSRSPTGFLKYRIIYCSGQSN